MSPDLVGSQIRGIEVGFSWVKNHAVDPCFGLVRIVLDVLGERTVAVDGEYVPMACVVVEGVSVDAVGCLFGC